HRMCLIQVVLAVRQTSPSFVSISEVPALTQGQVSLGLELELIFVRAEVAVRRQPGDEKGRVSNNHRGTTLTIPGRELAQAWVKDG
ncbi:MAG TPA: hypothetical protein QF604_13205, partial [Candidatus Latescibacteria bacterium]|nr:hypothetical protein [Candidatus Latescibacterota bacterium]